MELVCFSQEAFFLRRVRSTLHFKGCVPSEVFGEKLISIAMLVLGGCLLAYEFYKSFANKDEEQ